MPQPKPEASFGDQAPSAFEPLSRTAMTVPDLTRRWLAGEVAEDEYRDKLAVALAAAEDTRRRVERLPSHEAKTLYLASAQLYVAYEEALVEAVDMEPGALRDQVVLLAHRVRELADRVFDRGHHLVDPDFGADQPDVDINLPAEVPDWEAEGMAAGPPLDGEPGPRASIPPLREETRPTQPEVDWLAAVDAAGAPDALDLDGDLAAQARAYVDAADQLRDEPDPDVPDGRERSAILRLGWLIKADAARAAQAGLAEIAEALDQIEL
jgi:hypothetical protein